MDQDVEANVRHQYWNLISNAQICRGAVAGRASRLCRGLQCHCPREVTSWSQRTLSFRVVLSLVVYLLRLTLLGHVVGFVDSCGASACVSESSHVGIERFILVYPYFAIMYLR